ncbi:MAG TPA: haloacid dehalogenase-like hydrolase, partial [Woeseiaceae bacterium]|nr:haloacid dehalogenase-like hydrolase [Woeseiaceae bacterium]
HTLKKNKAYLSGLDAAAVDELARCFVAEEILKVLHAPAANRLREHLTAGDHVMLLSGTLMPIARALGRSLGVDDVLATQCVMRAGRYLAVPPAVHPFGVEKRVLLESIRKRPGCSREPVYAYADSHHDLALLEAVDVPVCVLPDARLQACARDRGWLILEERIELPATLD